MSSEKMRQLGLKKPKWQATKGLRSNIQLESVDRTNKVSQMYSPHLNSPTRISLLN